MRFLLLVIMLCGLSSIAVFGGIGIKGRKLETTVLPRRISRGVQIKKSKKSVWKLQAVDKAKRPFGRPMIVTTRPVSAKVIEITSQPGPDGVCYRTLMLAATDQKGRTVQQPVYGSERSLPTVNAGQAPMLLSQAKRD